MRMDVNGATTAAQAVAPAQLLLFDGRRFYPVSWSIPVPVYTPRPEPSLRAKIIVRHWFGHGDHRAEQLYDGLRMALGGWDDHVTVSFEVMGDGSQPATAHVVWGKDGLEVRSGEENVSFPFPADLAHVCEWLLPRVIPADVLRRRK